MLKTDIEWPDSRRYASDSDWKPVGFFSEGLCNSTQFDLLLGFFASSAISVLSDGFSVFLYNGGRMRLIINDILSAEDKDAINRGSSDMNIPAFDLSNLADIKATLSERDRHFFDCLAWLIRNDRIEIKIIAPKNDVGISHTKCGVFSDGINKVAFDGSCNFSRSALIDNLESLSAYCDWDGGTDKARVRNIEETFNSTFSGENENVQYLTPEKIKTNITKAFAEKELTQLLQDECDLLSRKHDSKMPTSILRILDKAHKRVKEIIRRQEDAANAVIAAEEDKPRFPYPSPKDYQVQAFENWKANKQKGLFAMATGTGKTITSLNCLLKIYQCNGYYKALILVPTIALVEQWERECQKFHFKNIYKVCSKNPSWRHDISTLKIREMTSTDSSSLSYIIISTYASFCRPTVFQDLNGFPKQKMLLIADEAHNMGSGLMLQKLNLISYLRRVGLSATPESQYDTGRNEALQRFFGCSNNEYTFSYTMEQAIQNGALCEYYYYPHIVHLTDAEMLDYIEVSNKIAKIMNYDDAESQDVLKRMLLKRKRIIHKAANKKDAFKEIIEKRLQEHGNLKYSLVYVPEGMKPQGKKADIYEIEEDIYDNRETLDIDEENKHLIDEYTAIVRDADPHVIVRQFTSESAGREEMLKGYAAGEIDVLTSMKCLDEGVDVPRSEFAVFCSSTGNPRQFIQRRGRVLRLHPDKRFAVIHDLIVVPDYFSEETFTLEKNLVLGELKRVKEFALLSKNFHESVQVLDPYLKKYELSIFNN